jgi:RNA polymerase sigma factor (sigma-70 family)
MEEGIHIKALLLVMVKNKSLDVVKTKNNRNRIIEGIKSFLPTSVWNGARQSLTEENFKILLDCLPEKEQKIVSLNMEGYTNKEIAHQLELSEKTIANQLAISRKKIKELWKTFME